MITQKNTFNLLKDLEEKNKSRKVHFFKWDESYSVKNRKIDEQHKRLFTIIDELYYTPFEKSKHSHLSAILKELKDYCEYHFSTEEELFKIKNYEFTDEHTKEHNEFMETINKVYNDFVNGKEISTSELMKFLKDWLTNHVMVNDMKYVDLLKD